MCFYSIVTEQDLINLRKLAEQQKNQRAPKLENRMIKQLHDINLAESLSTITNKLEEVDIPLNIQLKYQKNQILKMKILKR